MYVLVRAVALLALLGVAQDVQLRPRLVAGDQFRLEVTRTREDRSRPDGGYTVRTPVEVRVVSAGASGFLIDWRPGASELSAGAPGAKLADPGLAAQARALADTGFRIALNEDGEFERLANEAEVRPRFEAIQKLVLGGLSDAERMKGGALLQQLVSPELLIAMATRDVQTYFGLGAVSLAVGETLEVSLKQPTPIGEVPVVYRVRMDAATAETASISTTSTYDNDALLKLTLAALEKMGAKGTPDEIAKIRFSFTDDATYTFDRRAGLMRELTLNRRQSGAGLQRLDRWVIRLVSGPRR